MLAVFRDMNSVIVTDFLQWRFVLNNKTYFKILLESLKPAVKWKCCRLLSNGVCFQCGIVSAYLATVAVIREILWRPSYSPDLIPSTCHLFWPLERAQYEMFLMANHWGRYFGKVITMFKNNVRYLYSKAVYTSYIFIWITCIQSRKLLIGQVLWKQCVCLLSVCWYQKRRSCWNSQFHE
jgi:hypothetical protein